MERGEAIASVSYYEEVLKDKLEQVKIVKMTIENINGSILMVSRDNDKYWPAK